MRAALWALVFLAAVPLAAADFDLATTNVAWSPASAGDGSGYLAVWTELENTSTTGYASYAAVMRAFTRSGPSGSGTVRLGSASYADSPGVVFGGGVYLVVWTDGGGNIVGSLVTPSGIAATPFVIGQGSNPAVAWNGSEFFVVWSAGRKSWFGTTKRIFGAPVSPFGVLRGAPRQITPEPQPLAGRTADEELFVKPRIVWTGREYVVVWLGDFAIINCVAACFVPPPTHVLITRLPADGTPSGEQPRFLIDPGSDGVWGARIATNGSNVVMAADINDRIDLFVVQPDLTLTRRVLFQWSYFTYYGNSSPSDIAFDGTTYAVTWRPNDSARSWLETARVTADGATVLDRRALPIDGPIFDEAHPSIAGGAFTDTPIVVAEGNRIRAYFGGLPDAPIAPRPPRNLAAQGLHLTWNGGEGADGFTFVLSGHFPVAVVRDGAARATTLTFDYGRPLRIRAYNAGGLTDLDEGQRHRAAHP